VRIAAIGDLMLDVVVRLEEPLAAGDDVRASTRTGAGGQAANVAAWAASLGANARCIAKRGDDATAELVAGQLAAHGVELVGPLGAGATGVVVSIVGSDGDRSMASDRGVAPSFAPDELDPAWLDCDVLHVSGYALLREPIGTTAQLAARLARERGARVSVDVAAWTEIRAYGPVRFRELLDEIAPDVLFATEAEWEMLGLAAPPARPAAPGRKTGHLGRPGGGAYLTAPVGVIKRGPRGCTVVTEDARLDLAPVEAEVVDTTGAGDALAAGFLLGGSLEEAARRGLESAARCVAKVGSLP
jgi:ribokinase